MLSVKTHNVLDYVAGAGLVILSAAVSDVAPARNLFLILGFGQIAYSLLTNYRYSLLKLIPLGFHMGLDILAGVLLIAGPFLFGYRDSLSGGQLGLHIAMGLAVFALVAFTNRKSDSLSARVSS